MMSAKTVSSSELPKASFGSLPLTCFMTDQDPRFTLVNSEYARLLNCTAEDIIGKAAREIFDAEDAAHFETIQRNVLATGKPVEFERSIRGCKGRKIPARIKLRRIEIGAGEPHLQVIFMDPPELELDILELEKALKIQWESLSLFEESTAIMAQGLMVFNSEIIEYSSTTAANILEVPDHYLTPGRSWLQLQNFLLARGDYGQAKTARRKAEKIRNDLETQRGFHLERRTPSGKTVLTEGKSRRTGESILTVSDITRSPKWRQKLRKAISASGNLPNPVRTRAC